MRQLMNTSYTIYQIRANILKRIESVHITSYYWQKKNPTAHTSTYKHTQAQKKANSMSQPFFIVVANLFC